MKKNIGITTNQPVIGLVSNAPVRQNQETVNIPNLNDQKAIEAQREALRQQELNRRNSGQ